MNSRHYLSALIAAATAGLLAACSRTGEDQESAPAKAEASRVKRGANGEIIVTLDDPTRKRIGLTLESPAAAHWQPEVLGYGRVLDPAPLAALAAEFDTARAAAEASRQEYERLKLLAEQHNASLRALQAAEAAARRDQLLVESTRARLVLGWGKAISERNDLAAFVRSLTTGEAALIRVDLPAGESLTARPTVARVVSVTDEEHPFTGEFFDVATRVDPQMQGQGYLFLARGGLPPGTAVAGHLKTSGEPLSGVVVPRAAVVRHEGKAWVYLQTGADEFTRREVPLDRPTENGWFVAAGLSDKDRVVASGAQTVLSEELSQTGFMGSARD